MITRKTPFRQIGPVSIEVFREVLRNAGSPMSPVDELYRLGGSDSALLLTQYTRESSLGTSTNARNTRNPLGLMDASGSTLLRYDSWATPVAEWRYRIHAPSYKQGVYYPQGVSKEISLEDYLTIYVGGPGCLASGMAACANGETATSINSYIDKVVAQLNDLLGYSVPPPAPSELIFGRVPSPRIVVRTIPGDIGGRQWVPVGRTSAWDNLGARQFKGFCIHVMEGNLDGTDAYFRNEARMSALTDFGIGFGRKGTTDGTGRYEIYQWNTMGGGRAPHANGGTDGVEGDGRLFLDTYGVNAVNRDLRSIELAGFVRDNFVPREELDLAVALMAYLADQAQIRWDDWPYMNGVPLIMAHLEFATKSCPGSYVMNQIGWMSDAVGDILKEYQT